MSFGVRRTLFCFIISAGALWSEISPRCAALREMWVGEKTWSSDSQPRDTRIDQDGNVLQLGSGPVIVKFSGKDGSVIWERPLSYDGWDLHLDPEGNALFSGGYSFSGTNEMITGKFARDTGTILWQKSYPNAKDGFPSARWSGVDEKGDVITLGRFFIGTNSVYRLVKYAGTDGAILWETEPDLHGSAKVKVGTNGELVVAGEDNNQLTVLKLNGETGAVIWRSQPSTNEILFLQDAGMDRHGNIAVTGEASAGGAYTAKLRAQDGLLMWEQIHSSTNGALVGTQINVTSEGEVIQVGNMYPETSLTKYAANDKAIIWQRVFSPGYTWATRTLQALSINSGGHVFFIRNFSNIDFTADTIGMKLDGRTGETLWEEIVPNVNMEGASYERGHVAVVGRNDFFTAPMQVRFYRFGPELKARMLGAELGLEWDPNSGARLETSSGSIGGAQQWVTVQGSAETNYVRVVADDGAQIFRLVGE